MGFELNRIMKQYGVSTPGMANYTGTSEPSKELDTAYYAKMNPDLAKADITTPEKLQQHYTDFGKKEGRAAYDVAAFDEQTRKYGVDKESYDKYKNTYQSRLQNTPMYAQGQFQKDQPQMTFQTGQPLVGNTLTPEIATSLMQTSMTPAGVPTSEFNRYGGYDKVKAIYDAGGGSYAKPTQQINAYTVADLYRMYLGREPEAGIYGAAHASTRPNFINEAQAELNTKPTFGNQNLMNATGSYYGNQLKNPIYVGLPTVPVAAAAPAATPVTPEATPDVSQFSNRGIFIQRAHGGSVHDLTDKYALGGSVRRSPFRSQNEDSDYAKFMMQQQQEGAPTQFAAPEPEAAVAAPEPAAPVYRGIFGGMGGMARSSSPNPTGYSIFNRYGIQPNTINVDAQVGNGGGDNNTVNRLARLGVNAALSNAIGPGYDYANAARNILQGNIGAAAGNLVSGVTGGASNVLKKFRFENGGPVKTHYQTAGSVKARHDYMSPEEEADFAQRFFTPTPVEINRVDMRELPPPVTVDLMPAPVVAEAPKPVIAEAPKSVLTEIAAKNLKADPMPAAPGTEVVPVAVAPKAPAPFGNERMANIQALLASYGPKDSAYDKELTTARAAAKAETDAFARMLTSAMNSPEDAQSSKAEMYFRLAAAFGAPTKTGQFSENLGMVGKELGEYAKGKRATTQQKLALALEAQKMKMTSSKEDLNTLRALAGKEMDDKRAIATELIKDYIKSGEPQSAAGKQALDEGLIAGTPAYQKRVAEIGNLNVEGKMAQISAALANVSTAQATLALNQEKFQNQKNQQAKLTGPEVKLKTETEDTLAQTDSALGILKQAYALNPNTFDTSISDMAQRKALEVTNSKHPKVVATREQENLLEKAALAQLKSTFPGAISNDERKALQDVQGLGAKSIEERGRIMKNAYKALQSVRARHAKRLVDINQGVYRDTTSTIDGGTE